MRLIFIHGIAQEGKSSDILQKEWIDALSTGLRAAEAAPIETAYVPFYGDVLAYYAKHLTDQHPSKDHPDFRTSKSIARSNSDFLVRNGRSEFLSNDPDFSRFALEFAAETIAFEPGAAAQAMAMGLASTSIVPDEQKRDIQNWPPLIEATRLLDTVAPNVTGFFISQFLRTVHSYLTDDRAFDAVNSIVADTLHQSSEPAIVVGHSLGSVVAYHALHALKNVNVPLFITLGSPLAISAVKRRLREPSRQPACVSEWYNAFDRKDIVALNPLDPRNFETDSIENNPDVRNDTSNHHGISGYLSNMDVAMKIATAF